VYTSQSAGENRESVIFLHIFCKVQIFMCAHTYAHASTCAFTYSNTHSKFQVTNSDDEGGSIRLATIQSYWCLLDRCLSLVIHSYSAGKETPSCFRNQQFISTFKMDPILYINLVQIFIQFSTSVLIMTTNWSLYTGFSNQNFINSYYLPYMRYYTWSPFLPSWLNHHP
jgi:hypothetical protein